MRAQRRPVRGSWRAQRCVWRTLIFTVLGLTVAGRIGAAPVEVWNRSFNLHAYDQSYDVGVDATGNVYVTGMTDTAFTGYNYLTIKYDPSGNLLWFREYDNAGGLDWSEALAVDSAGNCIITGRSDPYYRTIKYDGAGNIVWNVTHYPGFSADARCIAVDASGSVYVGGNGPVLKYDAAGGLVWSSLVLGEISEGIAVDTSGNVFAAVRRYNGVDFDYRTAKFNPSGVLVWSRTLDLAGSEYAQDVAVDAAGDVYVSGSETIGGNADYLIVKYASDGTLVWTRTYHRGASDYGEDVAVDPSGSVYIVGKCQNGSDYDFVTVKYDAEGRFQWDAVYNSGVHDTGYGITTDGAGHVYVAGITGTSDFRTIKYRQVSAVAVKTHTPASPARGSPVTYQIVVGNSGGTTMSSVQVVDTIPPGVSFDSCTGGCSFDGTRAVWALGDLPPGGSATVSVQGTVSLCANGAIGNTAWVSALTTDGISQATAVDPGFVLSSMLTIGIFHAVIPATVGPGGALAYRIVIANTGSTTITTLKVVETLPAAAAFGSEDHPAGLVFSSAGSVLAWEGPLALAPAKTLTLTITGTALCGSSGAATGTAWAEAGNGCSTVQAQATAAFNVLNPTPTFSIAQVVSPPVPTAGGSVSMRIVVTNTSGATVTALSLVDTLTPMVTLSGESHDAGLVFTGVGAVLAWSRTLAFGPMRTMTVTITGTLDPCYAGVLSNTVWIGAVNACNGVQTTGVKGFTVVSTAAAVTVQNTHSPAFPAGGELVTYRLVVTNAGTGTLTGVQLIETLPSQVTFWSEQHPAGLVFSSTAGILEWAGAVVVGPASTLTVTITGTTSPCFLGPVSATAWVSATTACGGAQAKGVDSGFSLVPPGAAMVVRKTCTPVVPKRGATVTYHINVHNTGLVTLTVLRICDTLPPEISFGSEAHPAGLVFARTGPILCWDGAVLLPPQAVLTVSMTGSTPSNVVGDVVNTAWVSAASGCVGVQGSDALTFTLRLDDIASAARPMVVYPNPLTTARLKIALYLEGDADEVNIDIYDAGFHRVFSGTWKPVPRLESAVVVDGLDALSPGLYLLRGKARLAGGIEQRFKPVKLVVKR